MSSPDGHLRMGDSRLREVRVYRVKIFHHGYMVTAETYPYFTCFFHVKSQFGEKNPVLPVEKFPFQECDNVTTPYYPISSLLSVKWSFTGGLKTRKFPNF